jgi:hypothetical protein
MKIEVDGVVGNTEAAYVQMIDLARQRRRFDAHFGLCRVDRDSEARLQQHEDAAGRPRLREACHRIRYRGFAGSSLETAMQLGHSHREMRRRPK